MSEQKLKVFFFKLFLLLLVWSPVFPLLYLIYRFQVNIPFWDEWDISQVFDAFHNGNLPGFLFQQHTDSRMFFPKLIFLLIGLINGLDVRVFMYLSVFLAFLTSLCIYKLILRCCDTMVFMYILVFFVNLMLFSPAAAENWFWGMQFVVYITPLLLCAGLVVNTSGFSFKYKVIFNSFFSFVGTFSFANGLFLWFFIFPFNDFLKSDAEKPPRKYIWGYILSAFVSVSIFFFGYERYVAPKAGSWSFLLVVKGFFSGIGGPLMQDKTEYSLIAGIVIFILLAAVIYKSMADLKDNFNKYYPWLVTACYSALAIILISFNRIGVTPATGSRYTTVSCYFTISTIILFSLYMLKKSNKVKITVTVLVFLLFSILYYHTYTGSVEYIKGRSFIRETAKAALEVSNVFRSEKGLSLLYPESGHLFKRVKSLTEMKVLSIQIPSPGELLPPDNLAYGSFTHCEALPGSELYISGRMRNPVKGKRILLSYRTAGEREKLFDFIAPFDDNLIQGRDYYMSFANFLKADNLPEQNIIISAYGIDLTKKTTFNFSNTCSVYNKKT